MIQSGAVIMGQLTTFMQDESERAAFYWGEATAQSFFDLASLTKIVVTGSLLAKESFKFKNFIDLQQERLIQTLPELKNTAFENLVLGDCWKHQSGLEPHFLLGDSQPRAVFSLQRDKLWNKVLSEISKRPKGDSNQCVYSDLNFWLLGAYLERKNNSNLSQQWEVFKKNHSLPQDDLLYGPLLSQVIATESRHPVGEVNDDNAVFMNHIAPHAGLFATVSGLWKWLQAINVWRKSAPFLNDFFNPSQKTRFHCGWDRPTGPETQAGKGAPLDSVLGHLGYTGTALWWDPLTEKAGILLTNRVFPQHSQSSLDEIRLLRIKLFSLLWHNKSRALWTSLNETIQSYS